MLDSYLISSGLGGLEEKDLAMFIEILYKCTFSPTKDSFAEPFPKFGKEKYFGVKYFDFLLYLSCDVMPDSGLERFYDL